MSSLIILRRVRVENANAIAGLTWGFPAVTHFLGFTHALSLRLTAEKLALTGCGIICHDYQIHACRTSRDYQFALTRNPLTREAKTAPFNEEGRMHMTVSLVIECEGMIADGEHGVNRLCEKLQQICPTLRLAAGSITDIARISVATRPETESAFKRLLWPLMPGFALLDRAPLLERHFKELQQQQPQAEMLDAWLDFATLKMVAQPEKNGVAAWRVAPKPAAGFLVPLMTGWQGISPLYAPGEVKNARDPAQPFRFVEAVYGVGEWRGVHRINDVDELLWRYHYQDGHYLCQSKRQVEELDYNDIDFD
ncbi:type I-F CRISPR-associated protein Csy2 [Mixta tenebrionis]|uniref:Type I-F CRISPR-associated protein Csy2 n=1 Tax=Mixta tenebrionis TaxID=2562439 RepID=A0A506V6D0_9GAMM|nr:type I-F CRISPR-associated protein Csy2 [Mixta tenebrionis]TPW41464.1 type I-F CRISPR-associated protein Csy2 [Mixta tenebrionis]